MVGGARRERARPFAACGRRRINASFIPTEQYKRRVPTRLELAPNAWLDVCAGEPLWICTGGKVYEDAEGRGGL